VEGLRELAKNPQDPGPRAAAEFGQIEEAAIPALLAGLPNEGGADYRQLAQLGKLLMGLDGIVAGYLKRALGDRRVVPESKGIQKAEGRRPERRICDEAYLGLRRLGSGEAEITAQLEADEFLHLVVADKRIIAWQREGNERYAYWTRQLTDSMVLSRWLANLIVYDVENAFLPWEESLAYAVQRTNRNIRAAGESYRVI